MRWGGHGVGVAQGARSGALAKMHGPKVPRRGSTHAHLAFSGRADISRNANPVHFS